MRVFITGASGHIGSAVVPELIGAGHQVVGLARSDASAAKLQAAGAEVLSGDLADLDLLNRGASEADGVVHLAFRHDLVYKGDMEGAAAADAVAIEAIASALEGTDKPFVGTGGTLFLAFSPDVSGRSGTEEDVLPGGFRVDAENTIIGLAQKGVRSSVVRLSPLVHSELDKEGFVPVLIGTAREKGVAGYVGAGQNRWPAINTHDAASLYRLAIESAPAGTRLHGVGEEGIPFRQIAEAIGRNLNLLPASIPVENATDHFGFLGGFVTADNPASSALTRKWLGWEPTHTGLIADIDSGHYFA